MIDGIPDPNGVDYNTRPDFVVVPAGAVSATVSLVPREDTLAEGTETVSISLTHTAYYNANPATNVVISLLDNEQAPPPLALELTSPANGQYVLTLSGAATRVFDILTRSDEVGAVYDIDQPNWNQSADRTDQSQGSATVFSSAIDTTPQGPGRK